MSLDRDLIGLVNPLTLCTVITLSTVVTIVTIVTFDSQCRSLCRCFSHLDSVNALVTVHPLIHTVYVYRSELRRSEKPKRKMYATLFRTLSCCTLCCGYTHCMIIELSQ